MSKQPKPQDNRRTFVLNAMQHIYIEHAIYSDK